MHFDHILVARILFSLVTIGWAVLTVVADFNKTHATNPAWTPHASWQREPPLPLVRAAT